MNTFYRFARPFLFKADPEKAHDLTLKALRTGLLPSCGAVKSPVLESILWGLKFPNPIGLSAGFDKKGEVIGPMFDMGFGFIEAGTVTPKPQTGNPKPRVFRSPDHDAVINRMGFPNSGMGVFKDNISAFLSGKKRPKGVLGINIGMNKTQTEPARDYAILIRVLGPMADYLAVNISSPNTPGLRNLQKREPLLELLDVIKAERVKACGDHPPPLLVKLAPDLDDGQRKELAETLVEAEVDGVILSNTTFDRPAYLPSSFSSEAGGLSGAPVRQKSTDIIRDFYMLTGGTLPIIGVGGVSCGRDAYEKIRAGASLVQLYSALIFKGPGIVNTINKELINLLKADGFDNIAQAIGADHKDREFPTPLSEKEDAA